MLKIKFFATLLICSLSITVAREQNNLFPKKYTSIGLFDHKTGLAIFGHTQTLYQKNQYEIFAGLGLVPTGTLSLGWKYYFKEGPIQYYYLFSIQQINAMGGEVIAPHFSFGGDKNITKGIYLNLGISTIIRIHGDGKANLIPLPTIGLSWRR